MDNLSIFAVVVERKSLNKASQILNVTQPALSRKIKKLEDELGVQLFERKGKRLEITPVGQICYEYALEQRELHKRFMQSIGRYKHSEKIKITIGASLTTLQSTLPDLISLYLSDYPDSDIKTITGKTHEIVSFVKEKKVDVGVVSSQINQTDLHSIPLFADHLSLVLPNNHPFSKRKIIDIRELNELSMILFSRGTWYRVLMDELFHQYAIFPDVKMEIDSFEAIIRLLSTCKSATLLPVSYLRPKLLDENDLVVRNIPELVQTKRTTTLIFPQNESGSVFTDAFQSKLKRHFQQVHIP